MSRPRHECENICGSMDEMKNLNWRLERYGQMHGLRGTLETMDELCGCETVMMLTLNSIFSIYDCHLDCILPKITRDCDSDEPEELLRELNRLFISEEKRAFDVLPH